MSIEDVIVAVCLISLVGFVMYVRSHGVVTADAPEKLDTKSASAQGE